MTEFGTKVSMSRSLTIPESGTTSDAIFLGKLDLVGFRMPASFTGTFISLASGDSLDGDYQIVQDGEGADYTIPVTPGKTISISNLALVANIQFLKLVSNASEASAREITLALRPL